jgi:serine/threonine protein phosphatase PrpC
LVSEHRGTAEYVATMNRAVTVCGGWHLESWENAAEVARMQDAKLVWPKPTSGRLRVAVVDGVTPTARCATVVGVDGAMYASAIVRLALQRTERPLVDCMLAANRHLHDRSLARSRDQTQACVTAVDLHTDGRVEVVRAGDCEAWARTGQSWVALACGTALTTGVAAEWAEWQRRNAGVDRDARHDAEERFLGRPEAWTSTALGRFSSPVLQRFSADGVSELVLASDGARLSQPALDDLPGWLGGLRDWERQRAELGLAAEKVHDDVTVLHLRRARAKAASPLSPAAMALGLSRGDPERDEPVRRAA